MSSTTNSASFPSFLGSACAPRPLNRSSESKMHRICSSLQENYVSFAISSFIHPFPCRRKFPGKGINSLADTLGAPMAPHKMDHVSGGAQIEPTRLSYRFLLLLLSPPFLFNQFVVLFSLNLFLFSLGFLQCLKH